jgi:hypothetical protein
MQELSFSVVVAFVNKDRSILHGRPFESSSCIILLLLSLQAEYDVSRWMSIALLHTKKQAARAPAKGKSEGKIRCRNK